MTRPTEPVRTVHEICALLAGNEASDLSPPDLQAACVLLERTPLMQDRGPPAPRGRTPPGRHRRQDGHGPARPAEGAPRARGPRAVPRAPLQRYGTAPARRHRPPGQAPPLPRGPRSSGRITPSRPPWAGAANRRKSTESPRERPGSALPAPSHRPDFTRSTPEPVHAPSQSSPGSRQGDAGDGTIPGADRSQVRPPQEVHLVGRGTMHGRPPRTRAPDHRPSAGHARCMAVAPACGAGAVPGGCRLGSQGRRPPLPLECRFPTWQRLRVPSRSRTASETPGWP